MKLKDVIKRSYKNLKYKKKISRRLVRSFSLGAFSIFMMLTLNYNLYDNINKLTRDYDKYREIYIREPISMDVPEKAEDILDPITGEQLLTPKEIDIFKTENILNKFKSKYKDKLEYSYKLYNMNFNMAYMGDYVACTSLMAVSSNRLPKLKNENGAWVSRSFLEHITTIKNRESNNITKENINVIGKEVTFDITYFTYNDNKEQKEKVKKATFIIEGVLNNDDYLFDTPAMYDDEAKPGDFYNINKTVMYVSAEYIDKLYNEIHFKPEEQEFKRTLFSDNIAYGKLVFKVKSASSIPSVVSDIKKMGYNIEGNYYEASILKGITMIVSLIFGCIGLIILIVASIGIINVMIMAALERKKEIYTLKVIGGKNKDINSLFLFEGGYIGLIGSISGVLTALIIIAVLNLTPIEYSIIIKPSIILMVIGFSVILSIIAAIPAIITLHK